MPLKLPGAWLYMKMDSNKKIGENNEINQLRQQMQLSVLGQEHVVE